MGVICGFIVYGFFVCSFLIYSVVRTYNDYLLFVGCLCLVQIFGFSFWWYVYLLLIWIREKSHAGHSLTVGESVAVYSSEIEGATAYEVSGIKLDSCCEELRELYVLLR